MRPPISVVVPVFNEAACIVRTLEELDTCLQASFSGYEILAVDDGSRDETPALLRDLAQRLPALRVLTFPRNLGQSAAFFHGFRTAQHDILVTMDADGQNDPADIPALVDALSGCTCCCGYRAKRRDTWSRRIGSRLANRVRSRLLGDGIRDTGCSLKAFRRELTLPLMCWNGMHRFFPALFLMQGATIEQVPVNHRPRSAGTSKYTNLGRLGKTVRDLFAVRWLKNRYRHLPSDYRNTA